MRARVVPHVGSPVTVIYLGATVLGIVTQVDDDGRRLVVLTEEGESLSFVLAAATATYTTEGRQWGARLVFGDEPDEAE
ncbi:MAG TPA: hypothetical protein VNR66_07135 [Solirubrobacteraceae bacterium]|nr:hypothetical protein [Solirubrobacteraceae bacterium]